MAHRNFKEKRKMHIRTIHQSISLGLLKWPHYKLLLDLLGTG